MGTVTPVHVDTIKMVVHVYLLLQLRQRNSNIILKSHVNIIRKIKDCHTLINIHSFNFPISSKINSHRHKVVIKLICRGVNVLLLRLRRLRKVEGILITKVHKHIIVHLLLLLLLLNWILLWLQLDFFFNLIILRFRNLKFFLNFFRRLGFLIMPQGVRVSIV
jgi:hypothetical protein